MLDMKISGILFYHLSTYQLLFVSCIVLSICIPLLCSLCSYLDQIEKVFHDLAVPVETGP